MFERTLYPEIHGGVSGFELFLDAWGDEAVGCSSAVLSVIENCLDTDGVLGPGTGGL